jgi:hypothetical protein
MIMQFLGWQVGLTYMAPQRGGLDKPYFLALLKEMADHGMNLLSIMMQSYGYFDPGHDGYAWPVQNPKLACYLDPNALNAQPTTEFLQEIIMTAESFGIQIELMLNWGIWNNAKIRQSYPQATVQHDRHHHLACWLHCPDNPAAWQLGLDEVQDLLSFYRHPNVTRFVFERISYNSRNFCYCADSQASFFTQHGYPMTHRSLLPSKRHQFDANLRSWKRARIASKLNEYIALIKQLRPDLLVGLHTQGKPDWGHDPILFPELGISYVEPHSFQFQTTHAQFDAMLDHLRPNPCVIHFDARDLAPSNYPIWIKTPAIIKMGLEWISSYSGSSVDGILFFNEPAVSATNKKAIYHAL